MAATTAVWAAVMIVLLPWPYARLRQGNLYGHATGRLLIIWYPLFGQLYVLANHLRIDRSNPAAAIESTKEVVHAIVKKNLSVVIFPEGTRSRTGRLLPFKKGFVHIALQSRLLIVPIVSDGYSSGFGGKIACESEQRHLSVKYLTPIKTDEWEADKINEYVNRLHALYVEHLPDAQRPLFSGEMDVRKSLKS